MGVFVRIYYIIRWFFHQPYHIVKKNKVHFSSHIENNVFLKQSTIGKGTYIGSYCDINYSIIGNYTCIANGVVIGGMEHPYWDYCMSPRLNSSFIYGNRTIIGNDVWIATGCIIKQGVTIGDGAVIGANSFVTKDVPPYAIVFGTPAQVYKYRFDEATRNRLVSSKYWDYPPIQAKEILNQLRDFKYEQ